MEERVWTFRCDWLRPIDENELLTQSRVRGSRDLTSFERWLWDEASDAWRLENSCRESLGFARNGSTQVFYGPAQGVLFYDPFCDRAAWWKTRDSKEGSWVHKTFPYLYHVTCWHANPVADSRLKWIGVHAKGRRPILGFDENLETLFVQDTPLCVYDLRWSEPECVVFANGVGTTEWCAFGVSDAGLEVLNPNCEPVLRCARIPQFQGRRPTFATFAKDDGETTIYQMTDPRTGFVRIGTLRRPEGTKLEDWRPILIGPHFYENDGLIYARVEASEDSAIPFARLDDGRDLCYFDRCCWAVSQFKSSSHKVVETGAATATRYRLRDAPTLEELAVAVRAKTFLDSFPDGKSLRLALSHLPPNNAFRILCESTSRHCLTSSGAPLWT